MLTSGHEYGTALLFAQGSVEPVMLVGVAGIAVTTVIALQLAVLLPHEFDAYTQIFPGDEYRGPKSTVAVLDALV